MIHELLEKRYSPRAFSEKNIEKSKVLSLFEAVRWSPSSRNEQPWRFIAGVKDEGKTHTKIAETLVPGNRVWAERAPLLILAIAKNNFDYKDRQNKHAYYDLGQAVANLTFQATSFDLYVHQMGGFIAEKARDIFEIPAGYDPVVALAVGYPGSPADLPEGQQMRDKNKRTRKELTEIFFSEKFGTASNLVIDEVKEEIQL